MHKLPRALDQGDQPAEFFGAVLVTLIDRVAATLDRRTGRAGENQAGRTARRTDRGPSTRRRLAARRRAQGLSQADLAQRVGVERSTVARCEQGISTPRPWYRPLWADALGISLEELDELLLVDGQSPNRGVDGWAVR